MNRLINCLFFLPLFSLAAQTIPSEVIEENYYLSSDYIRSDLFLEQDLIYDRDVDFAQGLELICYQDKVKAEIGDYDTLYTPLDLDNVPSGIYNVQLSKTGFHTIEFQVNISSDKRTSVIVNLKPLTGLLNIKGLPEKAVVYINNHKIDILDDEVAIGENYIRISAFGYEDFIDILNFKGESDFIYSPEFIQKDFQLREMTLSRDILWTNDSKSQKISKISIVADAHGKGSISIRRASDNRIVESSDITFEKPQTDYIFNLDRHASHSDDQYVVTVAGTDDINSTILEKVILVKQGTKSTWRNNFSGFGGFLFSPTAEILPKSVTQLQTTVSSIFSTDSLDNLYTPALFSLRTSFLENLEISIGIGLYVSHLQNETSLDIFASGKYAFINQNDWRGFSMAAGVSLNYNGKISSFGDIPSYDSFAGLTGISLIIPMEYRLGKLSFHLSPEIKISPSIPGTETSGFGDGSLYVWNYFKTAVSLDFGNFSTALSAALQSPLYDGSYNKWPIFLGLDFNTTPGDTGFSLSLFGGFRYVSGEETEITSGISAGFIF